MEKKSWCTMKIFCQTFLVFTHCSFGLDAFEERKQELSPSTFSGSDSFLTTLETANQNDPVIFDSIFDEDADLNPSFNFYDPDAFFSAESDIEEFGNILTDRPVLEKRSRMKFIPRIGRKKRSLTDDQNTEGKNSDREGIVKMSANDEIKPQWEEETERNYNLKTAKRRPRNKVVFIPRIGKKSSNSFNKRVLYIPRKGKAAYLPNDFRFIPEYKKVLTGKAIFIPRIG